MVQQIMISHYATGGPGQHLLPGLEEATSDDKSPVLVFILTVNNDWSQIPWVLASSNDRFRISYTTRSRDQGSVGYTRDQTFLAVIPLV